MRSSVSNKLQEIGWDLITQTLLGTTGYSLNAFVDYSDPIEIIKHLTIGSEGTLNFISNITYKTVPEQDFKATSLVIFPDMHSACEAAMILKQSGLASAAELMDRAALRSTESQTSFATASNAVKSVAAKFSDSLRFLNENAAGLLIELRDDSQPQLKFKMQSVVDLITNRSKLNLVNPIEFSEDPMVCKFYWDIRKGLASMVGGMRPTGSTFLLEDVAAEISSLAAMSLDVKKIFHSLEYHDAILFGHALDGNLHLVFSQMFQSPNDIDRYRKLMDSLCDIVANKYQGSLKAEHGNSFFSIHC